MRRIPTAIDIRLNIGGFFIKRETQDTEIRSIRIL